MSEPRELLELIKKAGDIERELLHESMRQHILESQDVVANRAAVETGQLADDLARAAAINPT